MIPHVHGMRLLLVAAIIAGCLADAQEVPASQPGRSTVGTDPNISITLSAVERFRVTGGVGAFHLFGPGESPDNIPAPKPLPPEPAHVQLHLSITGADASEVYASRAVITEAHDNTGAPANTDRQPVFFSYSVGGGPEKYSKTPLTSYLTMGSVTAVRFSIRGTAELMIPSRDPASTIAVAVDSVRNHPVVRTPALNALGIQFAVYVGGGRNLPPTDRITGADDVEVELMDPQRRLCGMEIRSANGSEIRYFHSFYSGMADTLQIFVFEVPHLTGDVRLVARFGTEKSLVRVPLDFKEIAVPIDSQP